MSDATEPKVSMPTPTAPMAADTTLVEDDLVTTGAGYVSKSERDAAHAAKLDAAKAAAEQKQGQKRDAAAVMRARLAKLQAKKKEEREADDEKRAAEEKLEIERRAKAIAEAKANKGMVRSALGDKRSAKRSRAGDLDEGEADPTAGSGCAWATSYGAPKPLCGTGYVAGVSAEAQDDARDNTN